MTESFEFDSVLENRAVRISKSMIDIDEFFFVHDDETMKNELTFDTNTSSKFKQKRRCKNRNDEQTPIRQRQIVKNMNIIAKLTQLKKKNFVKTKN